MVGTELASWVFGALGVGGTVASLYIRFTIADTIIDKLDSRYTGSQLCAERHGSVDRQLSEIKHQAETIDHKVAAGFDSLRSQLLTAQIAREKIVRDQVARETGD
jgi:hypothetical protein